MQSLFEKVYNSLKHADHNPHALITVSKEESEAIIRCALIDLKSLGVKNIDGVDRFIASIN